jgi:hypothetical protein
MLALGTWLFFSPFWMAGYASPVSTAAWNSYVLGILVALFALAALASPRRWEEWVEFALGILLVISPFLLLFYGNETGAAWNTIIVGLLIAGNAVCVLLQRPAAGRMASAGSQH